MRRIFVAIIILCASNILAQDSTSYWIFKESTPDIATQTFIEKKLDTLYSFSYHLNPFYLRGDFNGDKTNDIAIPIIEKKSNKMGIAIIHTVTKEVFIFGAGKRFKYLTDDCKYLDIWSVDTAGIYKSDWETKPLKLKHEAIKIGIFAKSSGLLYWDGKKYKWYHLTD